MYTKSKEFIIKITYIAYKIIRTPVKWYWKRFNIQTRGVRVLLVHQDKVVLIQHWYNPLIVMPGGGVHKHETFEQAAIREIKEEIGISIEQLDYLLGIYENKKEGKNDLIHCFVVELSEMINFSKNKFNFEISDIKWVQINELPTQTSRATRDRIKEYLSKDISQTIRPW